jgi:TPR repeat protein
VGEAFKNASSPRPVCASSYFFHSDTNDENTIRKLIPVKSCRVFCPDRDERGRTPIDSSTIHKRIRDMRIRLHAVLLALGLCCTLLPGVALAGLDEGLAAYKKKDYATALHVFKPLAIQGDAGAQFILGVMFEFGRGVPQNDKEAVKWLRLGADQGNANAQANLGTMYAEGQGVPQDYKEAVKWFRLAAGQGVAIAQTSLGTIYANGQGVPQDYKEAVKWFRLAADQGDDSAQHNLGLMYAEGQGVTQDYKEAVKWYRLGADQGNASAQSNLGLMYANGQGVPQDYKEAVKWYRLGADQGGDGAQSNLGLMYATGHGVVLSRVVAYALFNLSAANVANATTNRSLLTESMSTKEMEAAQALARELTKSGNLLKALDQYIKKPTVKEATKPVASNDTADSALAASGDSFPARPGKTPGVVSCNTRCVNAACWRTYDNGKKVRFQAQHKFDALSGEWKFDSGAC